MDGTATPENTGFAHEPETSNPANGPDDEGFESFLAALASTPPPYRPPELAEGDIFAERYEVVRELGRGGMGTVYLAVDLDLKRKVAVKVAAGRRAEVALARLQQEATVMAQLSHPGIVTVFEASAIGDDVFLSLEFVPGGTVKDWSDAEPRGWREAVRLYIPIAEALAAAHEAGVVHRDFKPHNVLLDLDGKPRIADFGLARSVVDETALHTHVTSGPTLTRSGAVMGTPAYMAPEQGNGRQATAASDQFSFFVSLYETICDERPFKGATLQALLLAIESGKEPPCPGMPRALAALIKRGLLADPEKRHANMRDVAKLLRRILHTRRRTLQASALGFGALVAAGFGFAAAPTPVAPCPAEEVNASLHEIWNSEARTGVEAAAGSGTADTLDRFAKSLGDQRLATCEAHAISHTLSDEDLPLRSACLDRVEGRFSGLLQDVLQAPRELESTAGLLPPPDGCTDLQALRRLGNAYASRSAFDTVDQDAAMKDAERLLIRARLRVNRSESPEPFVGELLELAERHELRSMKAYALLIRAGTTTDPTEAEQLLQQADRIAEGSTNADLLSDLAVRRADVASRSGDLGLARAYLDHATTLADLGLSRESRLDTRDRELLSVRIDAELGETQGRAAVLEDLLRALPPANGRHLEATMLLADVLADRFEIQRAVDVYTEALAHPAADATSRHILRLNRAVTLVFGGRGDEALASLLEAEGKGDDEPPEDMRPARLLARAGAHRLQGELETARGEAETVAGLLSSIDPAHPSLGHVSHELALIELAAGDTKAALDHAIAAMGQWDAVHGPGSTDAGRALVLVSWALRGVGRVDRAVAAAKTATEILTAKARPADEIAVAMLAEDPTDTEARNACASSELDLCRQALTVPASNALSP